jgi:hypothetical protein
MIDFLSVEHRPLLLLRGDKDHYSAKSCMSRLNVDKQSLVQYVHIQLPHILAKVILSLIPHSSTPYSR